MKPGRSRRLRRSLLITIPLDSYTAAILAVLLLRILTDGGLWPLDLANVVLHWLLLGAMLGLPFALWQRRWVAASVCAFCAIAFLWLFGDLFMPNSLKPPDVGPFPSHLTIMTYNIGNGMAPGPQLADTFKGVAADVVAIQESTHDQAEDLQRQLRPLYPYRGFYGSGMSGIGILSRYPISNEELIYLQEVRPYLRATVRVGERSFTLIIVHFPVAFGPGAPQAPSRQDAPVLANMAVEHRPAVLLGDFNATDQNFMYRSLLRYELTDAFHEAGFGFGLTYPRRRWSGGLFLPLVRIDHIFTTHDISTIAAWVGPDGGSDHLPLVALIAW